MAVYKKFFFGIMSRLENDVNTINVRNLLVLLYLHRNITTYV